MGKTLKIPKDRSDQDMLANYKEKTTFENSVDEQEDVRPMSKTGKKESVNTSFFSQELQEKVGKALLEIKVKLFHEGVIDYDIKVTRQDNQVILTAVPKTPKKDNSRKESISR